MIDTPRMPTPTDPSEIEALRRALVGIVGERGVHDDSATLALHSEDIGSAGPGCVVIVVAPGSQEELRAVMVAARTAGVAIAPRGAGMSYTNSYVPTLEPTISLDLSRLDRILAIEPDDMVVTVEPGCTWAKLNAALSKLGLRTPFWGPMSGLTSTVGGGVSQLNAMFGAARYGTTSESVVAMTIVLADGRQLKTGVRGIGGDNPFYRHYGPDLTGLFCGDSGTLGIKAAITLRLIRAPAHEGFVSFAFPAGAAMLAAMAEMARAGIASETCAFDPGLTKVRLKRASLVGDVKTLGAVVARDRSILKGLISAARIAIGGRRLVAPDEYSLHVVAEGRSRAAVDADLATARRIAEDRGGREIENSIAKVIRAVPFPPLNSILGPAGEAWVPVHGMFPLSQAPAAFAAFEALFAELGPAFVREGVFTGYLFTTVSTNALTIEPVFYWPDERRPIHEATIEPAHLARLPKLPPNPAAAALVAEARRRVIAICAAMGAGHFQIGRTYPYRESRDAASRALLDAIKAVVDPHRRLNPGGLGFPPAGSPT